MQELIDFQMLLRGGFLQEGYPQITHFSRIVHFKPSISGYPHDYGNLHVMFLVATRRLWDHGDRLLIPNWDYL